MTNNQFTPKGFLVWLICAFFFLYEFLLRTVVGSFQQQIMHDLNLSSFHFSLISVALFLIVYGLMQIPAGILFNHFGLKKTLVVASVLCSLSSVGFASATHYLVAAGCRMLMGFGAAFGFIGLLISVYNWMPHRYVAIFIGLSQFIGTMGPMGAAGPLEVMSHSAGISWRLIFYCLGGIGLILSCLIMLFVDNNKQKAGKYIILQRPEKTAVYIWKLFARNQLWYIALFSATIYFTVEYLSENEGRSFLLLKGISPASASYMITIAWLGYAIGNPLAGFFSDMYQRRKIVMNLAASMGLVSVLMILYMNNETLLYISFFLLGFSSSGQSIGFATIAEQCKKPFISVGLGLNNALITTLAAINAPVIGLVLDTIKEGNTPSLSEYLTVFNILIAVAATSLLVSLFFIKETFCKSAVEYTYLNLSKSSSKEVVSS